MPGKTLIGGLVAIVALAVIVFAVAAMDDDADSSQVENPPLPTEPSGGDVDDPTVGPGTGGGAAGACPAEDVPGITDEERERCFQADGGGTPVDEDEGDSPVSDDPSQPQDPTETKLPALPDDRRAVEAPIDGLDIRIAESFPPQYFLHIQAGLPSGCAEQYGTEVERVDDVITVTVLNTLPADQNVACTMIYGMYEVNLPLGSDFESGETYTVIVNDEETSFTAQ